MGAILWRAKAQRSSVTFYRVGVGVVFVYLATKASARGGRGGSQPRRGRVPSFKSGCAAAKMLEEVFSGIVRVARGRARSIPLVSGASSPPVPSFAARYMKGAGDTPRTTTHRRSNDGMGPKFGGGANFPACWFVYLVSAVSENLTRPHVPADAHAGVFTALGTRLVGIVRQSAGSVQLWR